MTGTYTIGNGQPVDRSNGCTGTGSLSDIAVGSEVIVRDGADKVIGTDLLELDDKADPMHCYYRFAISVPDADFYSVDVAKRGAVTYSRADLEGYGWVVVLTLGE